MACCVTTFFYARAYLPFPRGDMACCISIFCARACIYIYIYAHRWGGVIQCCCLWKFLWAQCIFSLTCPFVDFDSGC